MPDQSSLQSIQKVTVCVVWGQNHWHQIFEVGIYTRRRHSGLKKKKKKKEVLSHSDTYHIIWLGTGVQKASV